MYTRETIYTETSPVGRMMDTDKENNMDDENFKQGLSEWVEFYKAQGVVYNLRTLGKRRQVADIGELVGPRKRFIMTKEEFNEVARTPLPMCRQVVGTARGE